MDKQLKKRIRKPLTNDQKEKRKQYLIDYKKNNPDKIKKYKATKKSKPLSEAQKNKHRITSAIYAKSHKENKKEYDRVYREKNLNKIKERHKKRYADNPEIFKQYNARRVAKYGNTKDILRAAKWKKNNPIKVRASNIKRIYGIKISDYEEMLGKQNHCCAICGKNESELNKKLGIDHCHNSKKIRGLLCRGCNSGIGFFKDNIALLQSAIKYLDV